MSKKNKVSFDNELFEDSDYDDSDDFDDCEDNRRGYHGKQHQSDQRKRFIREQLQLKQLAREFQLSRDDLNHI